MGTPFPGSPAQGGQQAENGGSSLVASSKRKTALASLLVDCRACLPCRPLLPERI